MTPNGRNDRNIYLLVSGFALKMVAIIAIMLFVGIRLDRWLQTNPLFTILLGMAGIIAGIVQLLRDVSRMEE